MLSYCVITNDSRPLNRKGVINSLSQYYDKRTFLLRGKCVQNIYTGDMSLNKVSHKLMQDVKEQPAENLTAFYLASHIVQVIRPKTIVILNMKLINKSGAGLSVWRNILYLNVGNFLSGEEKGIRRQVFKSLIENRIYMHGNDAYDRPSCIVIYLCLVLYLCFDTSKALMTRSAMSSLSILAGPVRKSYGTCAVCFRISLYIRINV